MDTIDFDTERFIKEIEKRPAIWNTRLEDADRMTRQKDWNDVALLYGPDLSVKDTKLLCISLQKKWRNIRDCFVKANKIMRKRKKSDDKQKVPYVYYKNLLFLKQTLNPVPPRTDEEQEIKIEVNDDADVYQTFVTNTMWTPTPIINNVQSDPIYTETTSNRQEVSTSRLVEDEDRLFFLSLVKEFKKIPDPMQIQAKLDILRVIKDAQFAQCPNKEAFGS